MLTRLRLLTLALLLAVVSLGGCAAKKEEDTGPDRLQVDSEFLAEALGESGGERLSREEILNRRRERELAAQEAARREAERKARERAEAEARSRELARRDAERAQLEDTCKRCGFYVDQNELDNALIQARALVKERPEAADAHVVLGIIERKRGNLEKALEAYNKAYEIDPNNEWVVANLGIVYRHQGAFDKARDLYENFLAGHPKSTLIHYNAGVLYELYYGDLVKALQHYIAYLKAGGDRKDEVNTWITVLALDLGVERPPTPGYVDPNAAPGTQAAEPTEAAEAEETEGGEGEVVEEAAPSESPAVAAAAAPAPTSQAERPGTVLYPFTVAKGQVDPQVLKRVNEVFRGALEAGGTPLVHEQRLRDVEQRGGVEGKCQPANCQLKVASVLKAENLVHAEIARSPTAWYVIVDLYNLKLRKKARLKLKADVADGVDAFYTKLERMGRAVSQRTGS